MLNAGPPDPMIARGFVSFDSSSLSFSRQFYAIGGSPKSALPLASPFPVSTSRPTEITGVGSVSFSQSFVTPFRVLSGGGVRTRYKTSSPP